MLRCPACNLPTRPNAIGLTFHASSNDGRTHGVIAICRRCTAAGYRVPQTIHFKTVARAADRALDNPWPYLCATFPTLETARLATAMLQHPQHVLKTLAAIGWGDGMDQAI
ncbi:MAG: hypothetical protein ROZ09_06680 [Thiobacillus sp.]|jgi:hypothetical protein|uniref:hypothetical protein n=1 Tax=Thiobacillus sp. TaxID=924 RepID=UPI002893C597|nr:hypothetical protein [Thiobacillus sp.]MDT3706497.1 hypothetical protein [Thiobacillus sp.]